MRCNYCGMDNSDGAQNCANCGKPLKMESCKKTILEMDAMPQASVDVDLTDQQNYGQQEVGNCKKCNYPLQSGATVCPNCNTPVKNAGTPPKPNGVHRPTVLGTVDDTEEAASASQGVVLGNVDNKPKNTPFKGTVNPYVQKILETEFTLKPIKKENEKHEPAELTFSGEEVVLNRGNLEQNNMSITSRTQAIVTSEDGKFFIKDGSDFKTTFVQAKNKTEIKDGDIILMGDRMFVFHIN